MDEHANRLIKESSPYLLQHAHNPVDWYPWGQEALDLARKQNRLIFISIGYAACHWCHVMERESFMNEDIAALLNRDFVCIKVDRQERPDVDQIYMTAVQLMTGSGGWPLSCFTTPDSRPFYGGTYFPPGQFREILIQLSDMWKHQPEKIQKSAKSLHEGITSSELITEKSEDKYLPPAPEVFQLLSKDFDAEEGGLKRVPKFPMPGLWNYLLSYYRYTGDKKALMQVERTVDKILAGGIYDQLAGGIARYSTDRTWTVPHFEKMLYDNAQFISLLSNLYAVTKRNMYRVKISESLRFLEKEMKSEEGGFYASMDADTSNEEGKYYCWESKEIEAVSGENSKIVMAYWGISKNGNWEAGKNVLSVKRSVNELSSIFRLSEREIQQILDDASDRLRALRGLREKPACDSRILTSWNALMIIAYTDAWQATGEKRYFDSALGLGRFVRERLMKEENRIRRSLEGEHSGFLDDYALTAEAFLALYQVSFDESWLENAGVLVERALKEFFNLESGMFHYASSLQSDLIVRQTEVTDHVLPSSNAVMAHVLLTLSHLKTDSIFRKMAKQMIQNVAPYILRSPSFFSGWSTVLLNLNNGLKEVVITGPGYLELRKQFTGRFFPDVLFAGAEHKSSLVLFRNRFIESSDRIYVCHNGSCKLPAMDTEEALRQLEE